MIILYIIYYDHTNQHINRDGDAYSYINNQRYNYNNITVTHTF